MKPTGQPSIQPSTLPSSQPSTVPTSGPTIDEYALPVLKVPDTFSEFFHYFCRPLHYRSVGNLFQRIFTGVQITPNIGTRLVSAKIVISPYTARIDEIVPMVVDDDRLLKISFEQSGFDGVLNIVDDGEDLIHPTIWDNVVAHISYKMNNVNEDLSRQSCRSYIHGKYQPTFTLTATDIRGRISIPLVLYLVVETAEIMYVDDHFYTSNNCSFSSIFIDESIDPTVNGTYSIVNVDSNDDIFN